jgi:hypothetical protein
MERTIPKSSKQVLCPTMQTGAVRLSDIGSYVVGTL